MLFNPLRNLLLLLLLIIPILLKRSLRVREVSNLSKVTEPVSDLLEVPKPFPPHTLPTCPDGSQRK